MVQRDRNINTKQNTAIRNMKYSGRTKYSAFVSKLIKLSEKYLSLQKTQKAAFFLIERSSAGEYLKS
jgi:hypothetical protein